MPEKLNMPEDLKNHIKNIEHIKNKKIVNKVLFRIKM